MKCALHNSRASLHGRRYTAWTAEALPYKPSSKAVLTKSKVNVNKWRFLPCSRMKRFNILKIPILPRLCYKFSVISIKIQQRILDTWQSDDTKLCLANLNQIPYDYRVEVRNRFKGLDLIECLMNYGWRFMTLYRRQGSRPSPWKRNAEKQNGCLGRAYK